MKLIVNPQIERDLYLLVLDDDPLVGHLLETILEIRTIRFGTVKSLEEHIEATNSRAPIAAFIDIHLSTGPTGLETIPNLRRRWPFIPIIVITADANTDLLPDALASGADDFIRKPIEPKELTARLQARLKEQARQAVKGVQQLSDVTLDSTHGIVHGTGGDFYLSKADMDMLLVLSEAKGTVVSRQTLKRKGWGNLRVTDKALDRRIHLIRKVLHEASKLARIRAVYGEGFRLQVSGDEESKHISAIR